MAKVFRASHFRKSSSYLRSFTLGDFFWFHVVFCQKFLHHFVYVVSCFFFSQWKVNGYFLSISRKYYFLLLSNAKLLSYTLFNVDVLQMLEWSIANFCCKRIYSNLSKHILLTKHILPSFLQSFSQFLRISVKTCKIILMRILHCKLQWKFLFLFLSFPKSTWT